MRARALLAVCVAVAAAATVSPARAEQHAAVQNNSYTPQEIRAAKGEVVTWTVQEGMHTVTSDIAGGFDSGAMAEGGMFSITAPADDVTIFYHCTIHGLPGDGTSRGSGMWGYIVVGKGSPPPEPTGPQVRHVPSLDWPSLSAALVGLKEETRYRIELAPGDYPAPSVLRASLGIGLPDKPLRSTFSLTIAGTGASPADVVLHGVVDVNLDGFHLERVTVADSAVAGSAVIIDGPMRGWSVDDVVIDDAASHGIVVKDRARLGRISRVRVRDASVAGIHVEGCAQCDLYIDQVDVADGLQGISLLDAGTVLVQGSTLTNNGVGVSIRGTREAPVRGPVVVGNTITTSTNRTLPAPPLSAKVNLPVGAGVWLHGAAFGRVEGNTIEVSSFGVAVTGGAYGHRILDNVIGRSAEADLGWDGIGANVCFAGNAAPSGGAITSMPPEAQAVYPCDLPATAGVPYPLVLQRLLAWGLRLPPGP